MKKFFVLLLLLLTAGAMAAEFVNSKQVGFRKFSPELAGKLRIRQAWNSQEANGEIYLITTPDGKVTLVDCGWGYLENNPAKFHYSMLYPALAEQKIRHIDRIIITHPHGDHIGALPILLRKKDLTVGELCWASPDAGLLQKHYSLGLKYQKEALAICRKRNIPVRELKDGDVLTLGKDVTAAVLTTGFKGSRANGSIWLNDQSVVFRLQYKTFTMLFTADCALEEEEYILKTVNHDLLKCDVYKVAHHGGSNATSEIFLKAAAPKAAIASLTGKNAANKNGQRVVKLMKKLNIPYFMSWQYPYLSVVTDGKTFEMLNINYPE